MPRADLTKTPYEKLLDEMKGFKELLASVADNMYKTEQSHLTTLETINQMAQTMKRLSDKFDTYIDGTPYEKNPNEGTVLDEEECCGGMTHILVGFKKPVSDIDLERMKKECVEKYGLDIAFCCKINERLVEVYLQESRSGANVENCQ